MKKRKKSAKYVEPPMVRVLRHLVGEHLDSYMIIGYQFNGEPLAILHAPHGNKDCQAINNVLFTISDAGGISL